MSKIFKKFQSFREAVQEFPISNNIRNNLNYIKLLKSIRQKEFEHHKTLIILKKAKQTFQDIFIKE